MSFLGSLGSSLFGTVTNALAGHWSAKQNAGLTRQNWSYAQSNAHQLEAQDLAKAGLNPILSATNSQIAGMGAVSGNSVSDNGLGTASINSATQKYLKGIDAEIEGKKLDNDLKRIEIEKANSASQISLNKSIESLNKSTADVNNANVIHINAQTASLRQLTAAQVAQIGQDIENSIAITRATVNKYGAESEAARSSAALMVTQAKLTLEQITGQKYSNEEAARLLSNPKRNLDAQTYEHIYNSPVWSTIYSAGEFIRSINPFGSISYGKSGPRVGNSH